MTCHICNNEFPHNKICQDHHHESGQLRGPLCRSCNFLIGFAHEDEEILISAVEYLAFWRQKRVEGSGLYFPNWYRKEWRKGRKRKIHGLDS